MSSLAQRIAELNKPQPKDIDPEKENYGDGTEANGAIFVQWFLFVLHMLTVPTSCICIL